MTKRRFALIKIRAGDWLLASNDGKQLWRIYRYEERGQRGDRAITESYWACALYLGSLDEAIEEEDLEHDWSRWETTDFWLGTRQDAIDSALG